MGQSSIWTRENAESPTPRGTDMLEGQRSPPESAVQWGRQREVGEKQMLSECD